MNTDPNTESTSASPVSPDAEAMARQVTRDWLGDDNDGLTDLVLSAMTTIAAAATMRERERISAEFGIPMLILNGQAKAGEITEADKAWADKVIRARSSPSKEGK